ncbi:MAG: hypothetical protein OXN97_12495 [Bryobacterales bacterium]|nr:hypothetical protein [Bryobacterales bacterium]
MNWTTLVPDVLGRYESRKHPAAALQRDVTRLADLGAVSINPVRDARGSGIHISVNLDWPSTVTVTEFFERLKTLRRSKSCSLRLPR